MLYCAVLYCIVLYCTLLYCIVQATGMKSVMVMGRDVAGDPEDPHDHLYLR